MRIDGASNPWLIARAHEARPAQGVRPAVEIRAAERVGKIDGARTLAESAKVQRLVAGWTAGGVGFDAEGTAAASGAIPMYRHPGGANAAATGVALGRALDLEA